MRMPGAGRARSVVSVGEMSAWAAGPERVLHAAPSTQRPPLACLPPSIRLPTAGGGAAACRLPQPAGQHGYGAPLGAPRQRGHLGCPQRGAGARARAPSPPSTLTGGRVPRVAGGAPRVGAPPRAAAARAPPRLAYSRPPTAAAAVTQDDLPSAAFLLVGPRTSTWRGGAGAGGSGSATTAAARQVCGVTGLWAGVEPAGGGVVYEGYARQRAVSLISHALCACRAARRRRRGPQSRG